MPSPTPTPEPLAEEEPGSGGRQLAIGSGTTIDHTNATFVGEGDERPICSYYEWCALARKKPTSTTKLTCFTNPCSVPRIKYVVGNLVGVGLTTIQPVSGNPPAELFDLLIATWSLTLTGAIRRRAIKPRRASSYLSPRVAPRHGHWNYRRADCCERPCGHRR